MPTDSSDFLQLPTVFYYASLNSTGELSTSIRWLVLYIDEKYFSSHKTTRTS